ncbi:MAG: pilus assembly protein N-terminal domain-containing protein, partial [Gammaproteobacteria bacterium]|nr:pilus assembly protein N-terminal domain-containing protein [Gammaproteobacteria bacterium]
MHKIKKRNFKLAGLLCLSIAFAQNAAAQNNSNTVTDMRSQTMTVPLYKSRLISLNGEAARISVGNPDIADILILRSKQLYVLGKDLGTTNVLLWDRSEELIGTIEVEVTHDLQALKKKLHDLLPDETIEVHSAQRNIILSGHVSNVGDMQAALKIA